MSLPDDGPCRLCFTAKRGRGDNFLISCHIPPSIAISMSEAEKPPQNKSTKPMNTKPYNHLLIALPRVVSSAPSRANCAAFLPAKPFPSWLGALLMIITLAVMVTQTTLAEDVLVGRFTVNPRNNAAGRYTDQSHPDYTQANPYFGNLIAPGPIFINATPGQYKFVVEAGTGCHVWSGDASRGTFLVPGPSPAEIVTFAHTFGQIALYYWDWYPYDNDPTVRLGQIIGDCPYRNLRRLHGLGTVL